MEDTLMMAIPSKTDTGEIYSNWWQLQTRRASVSTNHSLYTGWNFM